MSSVWLSLLHEKKYRQTGFDFSFLRMQNPNRSTAKEGECANARPGSEGCAGFSRVESQHILQIKL
jgi:hypothetical protein